MFFSEFLWKPPSPFVSFPLFLFLFLFSHSSLCPAPPRPAPVYKSRMYTALLLELRLSVQDSAGEIDFGLFPKDLNIISPWQGRSVAQARLVHGGPTTGNLSTRIHPPADTPPQRITTRGPAPTRRIPAHLETPTVPTHKRDPRITERGIDESVPHRPGGGERVRWRCCSSRGRTADRPTAPDTAEHIDYQSAHKVASH